MEAMAQLIRFLEKWFSIAMFEYHILYSVYNIVEIGQADDIYSL